MAKPKKKESRKKPQTRFQRLLRGPLFWILVAILGVTVFGQISSAGNQFKHVKTSEILDAISKNEVE